jgi:uncharacterized protein YbjQ (UPF0145 family)
MQRNTASLRALITASLVTVTLSACAAHPDNAFSAAEQQLIQAVEFIRPYELSRTDVNHTAMGEVVGTACQTGLMQQSPSQAEALLRLKLAAAELGANRVILKQCQQTPVANCRASWVCRGDGYQQQPLH